MQDAATVDAGRRRLLQHLAVAALGVPASQAAWSQPRLQANPFTLGVASGAPDHQSVVLWTRLMGELPAADVPVRWEVAADPGFARVISAGTAHAVAALAHSVHVEVGDLPVNRWCFYRFKVGEHTSPTGKTRTFAAPGAVQEPLRLGFASCQNYEQGYFNAYPHLAQESPDLMLFLGDYIYEYAPGRSGVRQHTGGWCLTLDDYRQRHALYKGEPELQLMHAACPWLVTWDDHEVQNDYAALHPGRAGPDAPDFQLRRLNAYQAFYEHMPVRASALIEGLEGLRRGAELRLYGSHRFGQLLDIQLLDTRQYRDRQACTSEGRNGSSLVDARQCDALADAQRSLLGHAQEAWLERQWASAGEQAWQLIAQSTLFGASVVDTKDGPKVWNDGWDGYPAARRRLTDQLVRHRIAQPVFLGGDVHENWVGYVLQDYAQPDSPRVGVEFCGTSISSFNGRSTDARLRRNPHFVYADGSRKGYGLIEVSASELIVHLRAVKDHRTRQTEIEPLASFRVRRGEGRIERL